jgi:hypothetical protein
MDDALPELLVRLAIGNTAVRVNSTIASCIRTNAPLAECHLLVRLVERIVDRGMLIVERLGNDIFQPLQRKSMVITTKD